MINLVVAMVGTAGVIMTTLGVVRAWRIGRIDSPALPVGLGLLLTTMVVVVIP